VLESVPVFPDHSIYGQFFQSADVMLAPEEKSAMAIPQEDRMPAYVVEQSVGTSLYSATLTTPSALLHAQQEK
jgi:hypothetical protein